MSVRVGTANGKTWCRRDSINSIDNDGIMKGYDLALVEKIRESISVPLTVLGGAGSLHDIGQLINKYGAIGAAAGSLFVFKGVYRAVLINYPNRAEKDALIEENYAYLNLLTTQSQWLLNAKIL